MTLKLSKFGMLLSSRPAAREAYFSAKAYTFPKNLEKLEIDFNGVKVLTPSWFDDFLTLFKADYPQVKIDFKASDNPSVISTLKILESSIDKENYL